MYGYIFAALVGIVLIAFSLSALGGGSGSTAAAGQHKKDKLKPVQADEPAADEPTPAQSLTAGSAEIEAADRHTPPA